MEGLLKTATHVLARTAEAIAMVIIAIGLLRATAAWVRDQLTNHTGDVPQAGIRLTLGRTLALGLEFLLGADILYTAVSPSWKQIGQLAAIAAIRTGLNFFLHLELQGENPDAAPARR